MWKNKVTSIVVLILIIVIIFFVSLLMIKINKIENKMQVITWEDIVDITNIKEMLISNCLKNQY